MSRSARPDLGAGIGRLAQLHDEDDRDLSDTSTVVKLFIAGEPWDEDFKTFLRQQAGDLAATSVVRHIEPGWRY